MQQVGAAEVLIAKLFDRTSVGEPGTADASVSTIAGGDGVLHGAVLAVGIAGRASEVISCFGDEVGITINLKTIAFAFAVGVVCEIAISGALFYI